MEAADLDEEDGEAMKMTTIENDDVNDI